MAISTIKDTTFGEPGVVYDKMGNEGGWRKFDNFFNPSFQPFVYMFDQCPYQSNFHYFIITLPVIRIILKI